MSVRNEPVFVLTLVAYSGLYYVTFRALPLFIPVFLSAFVYLFLCLYQWIGEHCYRTVWLLENLLVR